METRISLSVHELDVVYPAYRWVVLIAIGLAAMATVANLVGPAPLNGTIAKATGMSIGSATMATMGMIDLSTGVSGLVGGFLADRYGVGRVWVASFVLQIAAALLVPLYGHSFIGLAVIRFVHGCATGPILASLPLAAMQWFPRRNRALIIGFQGTMVSLGAASAMIVVPFVFGETGDWAIAVAALAGFSLFGLGGSLAILLGPSPPIRPRPRPTTSTFDPAGLRAMLLQPATIAAGLCGFIYSWQIRAFNDMVPSYIAVNPPAGLGFGPLHAGEIMSVVQIALMIAPMVGGLLVDRVFGGSARIVIMLSFLGSAATVYVLRMPAFVSNLHLLIVALALCGLMLGIVSTQVTTFVVKNYPHHVVGRLGGILMAINNLGAVTGVMISSYALHVTSLYSIPILLLILIPLIGFMASALLVLPNASGPTSVHEPTASARLAPISGASEGKSND